VNIRPPARLRQRLGEAARQLKGSVWSHVLGKAAGIACGMLALATIGALSTAQGLGGQRILLAEPSASTSGRGSGVSSSGTSAGTSSGVSSAGTSSARLRHASLEAGFVGAGVPLVEPAPSALPPTPAPPPSEGITADGKIVLNRANIEELGRLPGVGPKRAQAIIDLRSKLGRFRRATDLLRIKGIGPKSLKKLEPHFVLDPPVSAP
jgi:competence protein ComEA